MADQATDLSRTWEYSVQMCGLYMPFIVYIVLTTTDKESARSKGNSGKLDGGVFPTYLSISNMCSSRRRSSSTLSQMLLSSAEGVYYETMACISK